MHKMKQYNAIQQIMSLPHRLVLIAMKKAFPSSPIISRHDKKNPNPHPSQQVQ